MDSLLMPIVVSGCLGALIGLIRQWGEQVEDQQTHGFAGVRTHTLWALLGCLSAATSLQHAPLAFPFVLLAVTAHLIALRATRHQDESLPGSTSLAAALLSVFCGALVLWDQTKSAVLVAAITMLMVGSKKYVHGWTRNITDADIRATLQFVAISGVVLPLVPDRNMGPYGGFNPYSTWLMVVLISGLGFAGYLAMRVVGARAGILLMGVLGGLASSTATTLAFSRRSREEPGLAEHYAVAVLAACTVMLLRVVVAATLVNPSFSTRLIEPFAWMALPGFVFGTWVWTRRRSKQSAAEAPSLHNPLGLRTAVKFAVFYSAIAFLVTVVSKMGWTQGILPLAFVSG
ncbi:MAG TPA: MgtC/SapB family protein, partial [Opitutus sp.]|nr:MgtC/SapB family protein [Opitutus sp.]